MAGRGARQIIRIDEEKCNGCGQCVTACAEGALAIVDGKARVVNDSFCDGLGACIGECPQGALSIEMRVADEFDAAAVEHHQARIRQAEAEHPAPSPEPLACGCPGSMAETIQTHESARPGACAAPTSQLGNWPVQIHLLPIEAPFYRGAHLLLAADCVPFAYAGFHQELLSGRTLAVGCPKLDDPLFYVEKLGNILRSNDIRSLTVAHMEVPCCFGLERVAAQAVERSGKDIPVEVVIVGRDGTIKSAIDEDATCPHG
ncbi:MAG: 4Fe-4S binding protein [Armatimonadota bacterium]|nr:MAG: 4Fe-4S binding protein [Armatimonadota bacterium]